MNRRSSRAAGTGTPPAQTQRILVHGRQRGYRDRFSEPRLANVIDHEQVLHVARLARLELSEREIEAMTVELSGILEHVDRISALDLDSVEPTSHVVALENILRADEPEASLPRERALEPAPDPVEGAFRVPSPQALQEQ